MSRSDLIKKERQGQIYIAKQMKAMEQELEAPLSDCDIKALTEKLKVKPRKELK